MTQADKLELRRQTWAALGWEIIPTAFCENDVQKRGIGRPPGSATTQLLPAIESSIDIALDKFEKFCKQHHLWCQIETDRSDGSYSLFVFEQPDEDGSLYERIVARPRSKTLATALCIAIITVAREKVARKK